MTRYLIGRCLPFLFLGLITILSWKKAKLKPSIFLTYILIFLGAAPGLIVSQEIGVIFFFQTIILQIVLLINQQNSDQLFIPAAVRKYLYGILQGILGIAIIFPLATKAAPSLGSFVSLVTTVLQAVYFAIYLVISLQGFLMGNMVNHLKIAPWLANITQSGLILISLLLISDSFTIFIPAAVGVIFFTGWLSCRLKNIFPAVLITGLINSLWVLFS